LKEKARKVLIIALCLVAVVCAGYLIWYYAMAGKVNDSYDKAKKTAEIPKESPIVSEDGNKADIPIDFSALQEANPEVYAWIRIEDTNIDYPILQSAEDDNYYLDHTWEGVSASQGAIFTQSCNSTDFTDFNTIIYGHQMGEGNNTMFHNLGNYLDEGYMEEHPEVVIYTPERIFTYRIFAAVVYDDRHLGHYYNYILDADKQSFIDSLYNARDLRNIYRDDVNVTTEDRVITLSTCISTESEHRLLIGAVLTDEK